jgi:hypothetical protein
LQQNFIIETSNLSGYNLEPFFHKWRIETTQSTINTLSKLKLQSLTNGCLKNRNVPIWDIDAIIN